MELLLRENREWKTSFSLSELSPDPVKRLLKRAKLSLSSLTVHITGSTGKGTLLFFLEYILVKNGISVGSFLSPHIHKVEERFRLFGNPIPEDKLHQGIQSLSPFTKGEESYFEFLVCLAFWLFSRSPLEVTLWEVGVGGKRDATNVIPSHIVCFTKIEEEHLSLFGTMENLIQEKLGIIKETTQMVFSLPQSKEVEQRIQAFCHNRRVPFLVVREKLPLPHFWQPFSESISLAWAVAKKVGEILKKPVQFPSLHSFSLPARLEPSLHYPLVYDTGHTLLSAKHTLSGMRHRYGAPFGILCGFFQDKKWREILAYFSSEKPCFLALSPLPHPRSVPSKELEKEAKKQGYLFFSSPFSALDWHVKHHSFPMLVFGSHHLVQKAKQWEERKQND